MLYRFREAQAAELGLGTRADRRPKMASACKSLRECERWRGEILREISRKVSKIQDGPLLLLLGHCTCITDIVVECSWFDRLRSPRSQRRNQQTATRETALGKPDNWIGRCQLQAKRGNVG